MSRPRIPSKDDVAALSRDDWEALCRSLAAIIHDAEGVEDRKGKGNGMDSMRIDPDGARGWQFRRFDARFLDTQAANVLDAVRRAATRCKQEDKVTLVEFTVWGNIDLEPGHKGSKGERERFAAIVATAKKETGVDLRYRGITWIHAALLLRPNLRPDLFEDVAAQVADVRQQLATVLDALGPLKQLADKADKPLKRLVEQATVHYERGLEHGTREDFLAANRSYRDALALLDSMEADRVLEGRVLLAVAGVEKVLGNLAEAEALARRGIAVADGHDASVVAQARGTLALVLQDLQRFAEAGDNFRHALEFFETANMPVEYTIALTHSLEFHLNIGDLVRAEALGRRLDPVIDDIERILGGVSDISTAAKGARARVLLEFGKLKESRTLLHAAEQLFRRVEDDGRKLSSPIVIVAALSGRAEAARFQDRLDEAEKLLRNAVADADAASMAKVAADALYTLAIVQEENGRSVEALETMLAARKRYDTLGDVASAKDAEKQLSRMSKVG